MKKTKTIMLVLMLALMLMGVGYAAWSQNFTVTNNVSTGELKVLVTDLKFLKLNVANSGTYVDNNSVLDGMNDEYLNLVLGSDKDNTDIKFNLEKAYPGITVAYTVTLENQGTVPVKLSLFDPYRSGPNSKGKYYAQIVGSDDLSKEISNNYLKAFIEPNTFDGLVIEPHNKASYTVSIEIGNNFPDKIGNLPIEGAKLTYELKFNFEQATN